MTVPDGNETAAGTDPDRLARAWDLLREHPALTWTPPLWRGQPAGLPVYRAVERNLVIQVLSDNGRPQVRLGTGPLTDRCVGGTVDPLTPSAELDQRLDVQAGTFEAAVCELAGRVVSVYGWPDVPRLQDARTHRSLGAGPG